MAKSSKSSKDDKKQKSKGELRSSHGEWTTPLWVKGEARSYSGVLKGGAAVSPSKRDDFFNITVEDGKVIIQTSTTEKAGRPSLPAADVVSFVGREKSSKEPGVLVGIDAAEFKAGIERMAHYHAQTKALFSSFLKESAGVVFTGAMAGNTRKNKLKKKSDSVDSGEIKKAQ